MNYEKYEYINPVDYSDEELVAIMNELEMDYGKVTEDWTSELKEIATDDFDPYSFSGKRKLKQLGKKYGKILGDIQYLSEIVGREHSLRERYKEEQKYSGSGFAYRQETEEEFLKREELKTLAIKQKNK